MSIELNLLGEVRWRQRAVAGDRPQALLAALGARHGRPVPAGELVNLVWGEQPPANGLKSDATPLVGRDLDLGRLVDAGEDGAARAAVRRWAVGCAGAHSAGLTSAGSIDSHLGGGRTLTLPGQPAPAPRESAWKKSASGSSRDGPACH